MVKTYNISELNNIVKEVWEFGKSKKIWAFYAAMGAGKTTFIRSLCEYLQVKDAISSPTFALLNEYTSPVAGTIFHMDWYRLKNEEEAIQAGMEEAVLKGNYCFIEWGEKAGNLLPDDVLKIYIAVIDEQTRQITI